MEQILLFRGYRADCPFTGLGISGFYALMDALHFETVQQGAQVREDHILDTMHVRHKVRGQDMVFYNRVEREHRN
jgi:hypothetical protein